MCAQLFGSGVVIVLAPSTGMKRTQLIIDRTMARRVNVFYQKGCQEKSSASKGGRDSFLEIQPTVVLVPGRSLAWFSRLVSFSADGDEAIELERAASKSVMFRGHHGSIRGSWPMAISGSPRGHNVEGVTRCRGTRGRSHGRILFSNPSMFRTRPTIRRVSPGDGKPSSREMLKLLVDAMVWGQSSLLSSRSLNGLRQFPLWRPEPPRSRVGSQDVCGQRPQHF